ncbi:type VI secretion protein IcmF/TssM N-terminal domain-containing protein [Acanthopleuribacter pedis]|uniref:Type VI secretion system component TssM1 N-terminal domain-containing protein n=1 Tax=Acanthopleuribacter pedis TaxID=442870 RepID=A0A8J7Q6J2_9BACT|nr:type VI secretion protein IcmF/TssM N-terminal domain-containing protein [Acanthopleuribacter pedis]MBO1319066.1 hypothetical protein [Acanthopleuribacter pedis]
MGKILELLRLIPGSAKALTFLMIVGGACFFVYTRFGAKAALTLFVGIMIIAFAVWVFNQIVKWRESRRGAAFGKALEESAGPSKEEVKVAVGELNEKWHEALENLRNTRIDLYQLPWYLLIGEPQSGKSTTLKFSGLKFPIGVESISGGGGTRNCDWWFTEQGVILDTAGRFTFQEGTATDSAEWEHFLGLLSKYRPYCPINGVILVIPVDALLNDDDKLLETKARNISEKLLTVQRQLAIQFPVYVLITKCDQIYGFTQFFNKLNADQQREMFGWSNPKQDSGFSLDTFGESFGQISARIDQIRNSHFSQPHLHDEVDKTFIFPEEFRTIKEPLQRYMHLIFEGSVYKDPLFFRGYYLTSGLQEGQPIVKACQAMFQGGAMPQNLEKIFTRSRAFFIRDFYSEKVFPEEGLVQRAADLMRKDKMKRRFIYAVNIAIFVLGAVFVFFMYNSLSKRLNPPMQAIDQTVSVLNQVEGSFFRDKEARRSIFEALSYLKSSVNDTRDSGFLLFLKTRQNELTAHLQDTFGYLFLDRIMLEMFNQVDAQLREFDVASARADLSSEAELKLLTNAMKELKRWQYAAAENRLDELDDASIEPFLDLVINDEWNLELQDLLGEDTLKRTLQRWFSEVDTRSSDRLQKFFKSYMVDKSTGMYASLGEKVDSFYRNQPELDLYREKVGILEDMKELYEAIKRPNLDRLEYHQKLSNLAGFFAVSKREVMANQNDRYLSFPVIREEIAKALGEEYVALLPKEAEPEGDKENRSLLESGGDLFSKGSEMLGRYKDMRGKLPNHSSFVKVLVRRDLDQLPDPRKIFPPGPEGNLSYDEVHFKFYNRLLAEYMAKFSDDSVPYKGIVDSQNELNGKLDSLFVEGAKRVSTLRDLFDEKILEFIDLHKAEPRTLERFEQAVGDFKRASVLREMKTLEQTLNDVLSTIPDEVPEAPSSWGAIVTGFNDISDNGQKFDGFVKLPDLLLREFKGRPKRNIARIYLGGGGPIPAVDNYAKTAEKVLERFSTALASLNAISTQDLKKNESFYLSGRFEQYADLRIKDNVIEEYGDKRSVPVYLTAHLDALDKWSTNAIQAFFRRVSSADPCPECGSSRRKLGDAVRDAGIGFPMRFDSQVRVTPQTGEGALISPSITPKEKLDHLFSVLSVYKPENRTPAMENYVKKNGLEGFLERAFAWEEAVRVMLAEGLEISYKMEDKPGFEPVGRTKNISTDFTLAQLSGHFTGRNLNLNSPSFTKLEKNDSAEDDKLVFRLFNDTQGNRAESLVIVEGGYLGIFAFALDGSTANDTRDRFTREITLPLNTGNTEVKGLFHFKTSRSIPAPPDWSRILRK